MKIDHMAAEGRNFFTGYGAGYVLVNNAKVDRSVLVTGERIEDWDVRSVEAISPGQVAAILQARPEIVLLGSGSRFAFPDPAVLAPFYAERIGVEVMDTPAACRTYNILLGEGRNVVAALIVD
ncbi:hypothetical protein BWI17_14940 [Betaproteobacteria bacterium GR16-43]|nr:hypothetical protein BWI17_14940 [Betaproteobacteria bacterium GR16-43]